MKKGERKFTFVYVTFLKLILWTLKSLESKQYMDVKYNNFSYDCPALRTFFYCPQLSHRLTLFSPPGGTAGNSG